MRQREIERRRKNKERERERNRERAREREKNRSVGVVNCLLSNSLPFLIFPSWVSQVVYSGIRDIVTQEKKTLGKCRKNEFAMY